MRVGRHLTTIQLVDTKSTQGLNLLHFLERTVRQHFPQLESFTEELAVPASAYRGQLPLMSRDT